LGWQKKKYFHTSANSKNTLTLSKLSFEHGGAKLVSCPGRHQTLLRPCVFQLMLAMTSFLAVWRSLFWYHAVITPVPLPAKSGFETCERIVPLLVFIS